MPPDFSLVSVASGGCRGFSPHDRVLTDPVSWGGRVPINMAHLSDWPRPCMQPTPDVHVLLLNLSRSADRLARSAEILDRAGLSWERVAGVEGARLPTRRLAELNPFPTPRGEWFRPLSPGEIGCFLGHMACWQRIIDQGLSCAIVLEDDFALHPDFSLGVLKSIAASCAGWDVVKLTRVSPHARLGQVLPDGTQLKFRGRGPIDGTAYFVSLQGARKLLQQREAVFRPVDFDLKHFWERDLTVWSAQPNQFHQLSHAQAPSIIGDRQSHRGLPWAAKMLAYSRKHRYHVRFWLADRWGVGRRRL